MPNSRKLLIDCDTGIDDAMAILYGLGRGATVLGVGSVHGNVPAARGARNTLRVLEVGGAEDVPVRVGAARPLAQPLETAEFVHGEDGLGNTDQPAARGALSEGSAAQQIVDIAHAHPGEFTLVAVGPLTNLGLALMLDPELPRLVPDVVVMGGCVSPPGNITATAEANIWHDPEAAALVIEAPWQKTFVTLDATMQTVLGDEHLAAISGSSAAPAKFVWSVLQHYLDFYAPILGRRTCPLHDPLAVALALDPDLATYRDLPTRIELRSDQLRGTTVCDLRPSGESVPERRGDSGSSVRYVDELDVARFQKLFVDALAADTPPTNRSRNAS